MDSPYGKTPEQAHHGARRPEFTYGGQGPASAICLHSGRELYVPVDRGKTKRHDHGLQAAFFYLFAFVGMASAFMVIAARNPVHSVLFLILTFFNAAGLFLLTGAEFLAMILLVVYVGAVAVLFLFVVMMLDVDFAEMKPARSNMRPIGALVGIILAAEADHCACRQRLSSGGSRNAALPADPG
jgi:hypothetical protein